MRVAFIGCGKIAHFHADVLMNLGHTIEAVSYRSNKENALQFASKYGIQKVYSNWHEMINETQPDVLWVVPSWDQIDLICEDIISTGIPTFFEKPFALTSKKVQNLINNYTSEYLRKYQIGYNRRYYSVIIKLKELLKKETIRAVSINIPETINSSDNKLISNRFIQNSSHVINLLMYILDGYNLELKKVERISGSSGQEFTAILKNGNVVINIFSYWNAPENYSMNFYTISNKLYKLSPLEELNIYDGFEIVQPTPEIPIKKYIPKKIQTLYETSSKFKPGFDLQAKDFFKNLQSGIIPNNAHSFFDNYRLLKLIEEIYE